MGSKAVSHELSKTERLNGTNFSTWKRRIRHILFQDKVEYVIDVPTPDEPINPSPDVRRSYDRFLEDDKLARSTMLTFMDPDLEIIYEEYQMVKAMFDTVTQSYGGQSETYIQLLIEKFNTTRMKENEFVVDHCSRMTVIAKELAAAGHPIPDRMQVSTLLHSLPRSWDSVVVAVNMSGREVTVITLPMLLGVEAQRRERRGKSSQSHVTETVPKPNHNSDSGPRKKPFKKNFNKKKNFNAKNVTCYNCKKQGHYMSNCPEDDNSSKNSGSKDIVCIVSESLLADCDADAWWIDSASSRHVTKSRECFVDINELKTGEHRVYMGNNTYCDVLGIGTVKLSLPGQNNLVLTDVLFAPRMRRNLVSVTCLDDKGFEVRIRSGKVSVGKHGRILFWGTKVDGLYRLNK